VCYEIDESLYDAYEITSEDEIFGRHENGEITRLTDFTSKLDLATGIILEEEDYELNLVGYFLKGDLVQLKFKDAKAVNRKDRRSFRRLLTTLRKEWVLKKLSLKV